MYPSPTAPEHVVHHNRGPGYAVAGQSGTIAAAIAANSLLWALYCANGQKAVIYLDRLRISFTTIAAFGAPVTGARALALYRAAAGNGHALPTGGNALAVAKKDSTFNASIASSCIANAGAMVAGSIVREAAPIALLDVAAAGNAGNRQEMVYELAAPYNMPIVLNPDEMLVVSNPNAMDAGGTWQLAIDECHWVEALANAVG